MPRPRGLPKTGGRSRGTPNKATQCVLNRLQELGCDPITGLATIAMSQTSSLDLKFRCFTELAQYAYPRRKALDLDSETPQIGFILDL